MSRLHRAARASFGGGEYVGTRRQHAILKGSVELDNKMVQGTQTSVSMSVIVGSKDIKVLGRSHRLGPVSKFGICCLPQVRKWKRVLVKLGQLKAPRWVPETQVRYEWLIARLVHLTRVLSVIAGSHEGTAEVQAGDGAE